MAKYNKTKIENTTVVLDGNEYISCEFVNSRIVITRGNFVLTNSNFKGCHFDFAGEAAVIKDIVMSLVNQKKK